jgi:bifunctional DNase/RNase
MNGGAPVTLVRIKALNHNPTTQMATVVLETEGCGLALGFLIPMNEANRLARVLGLVGCRCAPVYELILEIASHGGFSVSRTVLDGGAEGICASLVLGRDGTAIEVSCHPADAVALAVRTGAPIYATAGAMEHACRLGDAHAHDGQTTTSYPEPEDVASWLGRLRPEDFGPATTR